MQEYLVPAGFGEIEYVEKHSRFIGRVWPIENEQDALSHIKEMREKHWDATHNVYAYSVKNGGIMRYSDDGEPSGTSGMPVLNVFRSNNVQDFCCVVTRYFGGILLGAGGLVRAYTKSATMALEQAGKAEMRTLQNILVTCSYSQFERIKADLARTGIAPEEVMYGADVTMLISLTSDERERAEKRITELSAATAKVELLGEVQRAVRIE